MRKVYHTIIIILILSCSTPVYPVTVYVFDDETKAPIPDCQIGICTFWYNNYSSSKSITTNTDGKATLFPSEIERKKGQSIFLIHVSLPGGKYRFDYEDYNEWILRENTLPGQILYNYDFRTKRHQRNRPIGRGVLRKCINEKGPGRGAGKYVGGYLDDDVLFVFIAKSGNGHYSYAALNNYDYDEDGLIDKEDPDDDNDSIPDAEDEHQYSDVAPPEYNKPLSMRTKVDVQGEITVRIDDDDDDGDDGNIIRFCPYCGRRLRDAYDFIFCPYCGKKLKT